MNGMIKFCYALLLIFGLFSSVLHAQPVTLKVILKNSETDSIKLLDADDIIVATAGRNKDQSYYFSIASDSCYYSITKGREYFLLYLEPGYDLTITADAANLDATLSFSGTGAAENNYLAKKSVLLTANENRESPEQMIVDTDNLTKIENKYVQIKNLLNHSAFKNRRFVSTEENSLLIEELNDKLMVLNLMRNMGPDKKTAKLQTDSLTNHIDMNAKIYAGIPAYTQLLMSVILNKSGDILSDTTNQSKKDFSSVALYLTDSIIHNQEIKDKVAFAITKVALAMAKDKEAVYQKFTEIVKNEKIKSQVAAPAQLFTSMKAGNISPDFSYKDANGKTVTLSSLKGKFVYIDAWATWCGPCKREMPYLDTLQEVMKNKNITFVSICVSDTKEKWLDYISHNKMKGMQLFAETKDNFQTFYQISFIPRFILIDPKGIIVDPDAKRPSDLELKDYLENLMR